MLFDGTNKEFEKIVEQNKLLLYSVVYGIAKGADADDIVQETFIHAYYNYGTLKDKEKLSSWLCAIARNKAYDAAKRLYRTVSIDTIDRRAHVNSPENIFLRREKSTEIMERISALPEKYREIVLLYYFAEKSISEISQLSDLPEGTVKFRLFEGRKKLKKELIHMMNEEKRNIERKNIWENIKKRAEEALSLVRKNDTKSASEICDEYLKEEYDLRSLSRSELEILDRLYGAKFKAVRCAEGLKKCMKYLEKHVEIAEILGSEKGIMNAYSFYATELSNLGNIEKCEEYRAKAAEIAKKLGNVKDLADSLYWQAMDLIGKTDDNEENEKLFKEALEKIEIGLSYEDILLETDSGKVTHALLFAAKKAIVRAKDLAKTTGQVSTVPMIRKTEEGYFLAGQPGFSMGEYCDFVLRDILYFVNIIDPPLCEEMEKGYTFQKNTFSFSHEPVKTVFEVISMEEDYETPAGIFKNCLHTRYTNETSEKRNFRRNGVSDFWFAPNVGIVGYHFKAISDVEMTLKLSEYKVTPSEQEGKCALYLPLEIGNSWSYQAWGANGKPFEKVDYENTFEVISRLEKGDVTLIAHSGWICKK